MSTALLLGGPSDGKVFPLPEEFGNVILTQEPPEIGLICELASEANGYAVPVPPRHRYERRNLDIGVSTRFVIFVHRGFDA